MIKVVVLRDTDDGEQLLAEMHISNEGEAGMRRGMTAYHAELAVDDGEGARLMTVMIEHPREQGNVLALLREILNTLGSDQLLLKGPIGGEAGSSNMAREVRRAGFEIQGWSSRLHHNRPTLRSGQPEQPGDD